MAEWNLGRVGSCCAVTGRAFAEGEKVVAAIYETRGDEVFVRRDFAQDAFRQTGGRISVEEGQPPQAPFGNWLTTIQAREARKRVFVDNAVLVEFFERLADQAELRRVQFRYVLGLILMRKRVLRYERSDTLADGTEQWTLTLVHPVQRSGDGPLKLPVTLVRPAIDESQISQISEQLGAILAGDDQALAK